jgi:hypothetical protein
VLFDDRPSVDYASHPLCRKCAAIRLRDPGQVKGSARTGRTPARLTAIPYFAWANRTPGSMAGWILEGESFSLLDVLMISYYPRLNRPPGSRVWRLALTAGSTAISLTLHDSRVAGLGLLPTVYWFPLPFDADDVPFALKIPRPSADRGERFAASCNGGAAAAS